MTPPIKKYVLDESPGWTWEKRYKQLEAHHVKEVTWYASALDRTLKRELGGLTMTLAALRNANDLNRDALAEVELERVGAKIEKIREKQKTKPKHGPLPEAVGPRAGSAK